MTPWLAAMFIGFLVVGLGRSRSIQSTSRRVALVIVVVLGYEAAKLHAI